MSLGDRGILEVFGPYGIVRFLSFVSKQIKFLHSGIIYHYIFIMLLAVCLFLFFIYNPVFGVIPVNLIFISFLLFGFRLGQLRYNAKQSQGVLHGVLGSQNKFNKY